jgi:hypothetical protein
MPVSQEHHQRVAVTVAIGLGRLDQPLDLVRSEVLAGPKLGIRWSVRRHCSIFSAWRDQAQVRFCHEFSYPFIGDCP